VKGFLAQRAVPCLLAALAASGAHAEVEPVDFTIAEGEALYVEFELDDPSSIFADFHAFEADFKPFAPVTGGGAFTAVVSVSDPVSDDLLGVSLPVLVNVTPFLSAIGPTFCDPALAPDATHCAFHPEAADLSGYGSGLGRVALANRGGDPFRVGGVELLYGRFAPGGATSEFVRPAFAITDAFVPEPSRELLLALAGRQPTGRPRRPARASEPEPRAERAGPARPIRGRDRASRV
jgi:hypothetical protein